MVRFRASIRCRLRIWFQWELGLGFNVWLKVFLGLGLELG